MPQKILRRERPGSVVAGIELPLLECIFRARGVTSATEIDYSLANLLPPTSLGGIAEAAGLLGEAIRAGARILLVGDFDADGATSCALAVRALRAMGAGEVGYLVPNRFQYGYGLTPPLVEVAKQLQPDLIITVDNGISSIDGVQAAQALGITVLVTDHHLPGDQLPSADVIVNPNLPGDSFPSKNLAGVGVIFYVMIALRAGLRKGGWFSSMNILEPNMADYLDLVALGTVADCVALDANNRILVSQGLERIRTSRCCIGIIALLKIASRNPATTVASDLGFAVGPRINAAGRMKDMSTGIECLLTDDKSVAEGLAVELDAINKERKSVEGDMKQQATALADALHLDADSPPVAYCLYNENWHQGVVDSLRAEFVKKPAGRCSHWRRVKTGEWKGSARSVQGLHIRDVLARVDAVRPGLMSKYGGHAMAAGLSTRETHLKELEKLFIHAVQEMTDARDWTDPVLSDGQLAEADISLDTAMVLRNAGPWGQGFPEPVFDGIFNVMESRIVGDSHLKMRLGQDDRNTTHDAIMFGYMDNRQEMPSSRVRVAYKLDVNEFRGSQITPASVAAYRG